MRVMVKAICTGGATNQGVFELDVPVMSTLPMTAGQYGPPIPVYDMVGEPFRLAMRKLTLRCTQTECLADVGCVHAVIEVGVALSATYTTDAKHYSHTLDLIQELGAFMEVIVPIIPEEVEAAQPAAA